MLFVEMKSNKFMGIGLSADMFVSRNVKVVEDNKICDGMIFINNKAYAVNPKVVSEYYAKEKIKPIYKLFNTFRSESPEVQYIYNSTDEKFVLVNEIKSGENIYSKMNKLDIGDAKEILNNDDLLETLNEKDKICKILNITDMKVLNKILIDGDYANVCEEFTYNKNIYTFGGFLYFGSVADYNSPYKDRNGKLLENPLFFKLGAILEIYPDWILKKVGLKYLRSEVCNIVTSKYSNYSDRFVLLTLFIKFRRFFFSVSIDLKYVFERIINFLRTFNATNFNTFDVKKLKTLKFWLTMLHSMSKEIFLILRTFGIGVELFNTLSSVNVDFLNSSIGSTVRKNLYCKAYK